MLQKFECNLPYKLDSVTICTRGDLARVHIWDGGVLLYATPWGIGKGRRFEQMREETNVYKQTERIFKSNLVQGMSLWEYILGSLPDSIQVTYKDYHRHRTSVGTLMLFGSFLAIVIHIIFYNSTWWVIILFLTFTVFGYIEREKGLSGWEDRQEQIDEQEKHKTRTLEEMSERYAEGGELPEEADLSVSFDRDE